MGIIKGMKYTILTTNGGQRERFSKGNHSHIHAQAMWFGREVSHPKRTQLDMLEGKREKQLESYCTVLLR